MLVAGDVEFVRPVAVEVREQRGVLEAAGVGVDQLLLPRGLGSRTGAQQPDAAAVARRDQLLLAVAVDVARRQEAAQAIVQGGDHNPLVSRRIGVVAADLHGLEQLLVLADLALDHDVEFVATIAVDIVDQDLLGMTQPQVGDHRALAPVLGNVTHHLTGLGLAVQPVGLAGSGVDLERPIAVQVSDLDLVNEGVGLLVDLDHLEATARLGAEHDHDALVVGRYRDAGLAVAVEVGHLRIAHAAPFAAEVLGPLAVGAECAALWGPGLHMGGRPRQGQQQRPGAAFVEHGLVEDVAFLVLDGRRLPLAALAVQELETSRPRNRLALLIHELGERQHDAGVVGVGLGGVAGRRRRSRGRGRRLRRLLRAAGAQQEGQADPADEGSGHAGLDLRKRRTLR